jgi:hypothetical protein
MFWSVLSFQLVLMQSLVSHPYKTAGKIVISILLNLYDFRV